MEMDKSQHIENQVERTLASLDGISRASANPYLYSKIRQKMLHSADTDSPWARIQLFLSKPVIAFSLICMLLIVNVFFVRSLRMHATQTNNTESEQIFATEYNLAPSGFYDQTIASNE